MNLSKTDSTRYLCAAAYRRINTRFQNRQEREKIKRMIRENLSYNYGAITSIRELASPSDFNQYFQLLDQDMYLKIIERQLTDSLCEFLDTKNIDISELKSRQNGIFNQGIIISGGLLKAKNLSVGEQAKSVYKQA